MLTTLENSETRSSQVTFDYILLYFPENLHVKDTISPIKDLADRDPEAAFGDLDASVYHNCNRDLNPADELVFPVHRLRKVIISDQIRCRSNRRPRRGGKLY